MKILVLSDSHGNLEHMVQAVEKEQPRMILHLGDCWPDAERLRRRFPHIPLERILIETDAPFILPYCKDVIPPKLLRRARNTSLILQAVIEKIAELKGITPEKVEKATAENAIRLFRLPI